MGEATKKGGRSRENQATKTLSIRGIRSSTMAFHSLELGFRDGDQVKKHDWTPVFYSISTIFLDYYRVFSGLYCDSLFITDGIISWDYWSSTIILIYQGSPWCFTNTNIITDLSILHSPDSPGPNKSFRIRRPVDQALGQSFDEKEEQWPAVPAVVPGAEDGNDTDCDTFLAAEFSCLANIS